MSEASDRMNVVVFPPIPLRGKERILEERLTRLSQEIGGKFGRIATTGSASARKPRQNSIPIRGK